MLSSEINACCGAEAACSSLMTRFSLSSNRLLSWVLLGKDHSSAPTAAEMSPTHQSSLKLQETALQLTPVPHFTFYSVSPLYVLMKCHWKHGKEMKPRTMEVTEECEFREPGIGRMFPTHRGWRSNAKKMRISCKSMELTGCRVYLSGRVFAYPAGYPQYFKKRRWG